MRSHYSLLCITALLMLISCGPTFTTHIPKETSLPRSVALLPADYFVDIPRERVDTVRRALINALRNEDFVVVEDKVVNRICSSPACPEKAVLGNQYLVDGFITLKLSSISENNFLAGYYDSLSGEVVFQNRDGAELLKAQHTERVRGGLIFESGQVLQGIISQVKRSGDSGFESLAEKFAARIIGDLPQVTTLGAPSRQEGTEVALSAAQAEWNSPGAYKVCAEGTPHSFASLLLGTQRASLREVSPGRYCGAVSALAAFNAPGVTQVELRTAFGNSVRRAVSMPSEPPCTLQNRLEIKPSNGSTLLSILCARIGADRSNEDLGCSSEVSQCTASKVIVFSSTTETGPFTKIAEVKKATAAIPAKKPNLRAIAVGAGGVSSQAISFNTEKP
jgi:hypothetical protein